MIGQRNWWKLAFFAALLVFEVAREIAVLGMNQSVRIGGSGYVLQIGDYVIAEGAWRRTDKGEHLSPVAISIECSSAAATCREATATVMDLYLSPPDVSTYDAIFSENEISYVNNSPKCVRYTTKIDLQLNKVLTLREAKNTFEEVCKATEQRIEMELTAGNKAGKPDPLEEHFLPLFSVVAYVVKTFN